MIFQTNLQYHTLSDVNTQLKQHSLGKSKHALLNIPVTMYRMCARVLTTPAPSYATKSDHSDATVQIAGTLIHGTIREIPLSVCDGKAMTGLPPGDMAAPLMKSCCPPTPLNILVPMLSATTCPVRSTSMAELMEVTLGFCQCQKVR